MRIAGLTTALVSLLGVAAPEKNPPWYKDVAAAFAEARRADKPVLAVLHCPH